MMEELGGNYLKAEDVEALGDKWKITSVPELVHSEQYDTDRYEMDVKCTDNPKEERRLSMNHTTSNFYIKKFGNDEKKWVGQVVELEVQKAKIGGQSKKVVYGKGAAD